MDLPLRNPLRLKSRNRALATRNVLRLPPPTRERYGRLNGTPGGSFAGRGGPQLFLRELACVRCCGYHRVFTGLRHLAFLETIHATVSSYLRGTVTRRSRAVLLLQMGDFPKETSLAVASGQHSLGTCPCAKSDRERRFGLQSEPYSKVSDYLESKVVEALQNRGLQRAPVFA